MLGNTIIPWIRCRGSGCQPLRDLELALPDGWRVCEQLVNGQIQVIVELGIDGPFIELILVSVVLLSHTYNVHRLGMLSDLLFPILLISSIYCRETGVSRRFGKW